MARPFKRLNLLSYLLFSVLSDRGTNDRCGPKDTVQESTSYDICDEIALPCIKRSLFFFFFLAR